jgi:hypothetical protein
MANSYLISIFSNFYTVKMFGQGYIKVISAAAEFGGRSLEMPIK